MKPTKKLKGFATMTYEQRSAIARMGGRAISRDRRHMAMIGSTGGQHSHSGDMRRRHLGRILK